MPRCSEVISTVGEADMRRCDRKAGHRKKHRAREAGNDGRGRFQMTVKWVRGGW